MVYCQRCSAELPDYAKFCHRCGMRRALDPSSAIHQQSQIPVVTQQSAPSTVVYKKQEINRQAARSSRAKAVRYTFIGTCIVLLVGLVVLFTNPFFRTMAQVNVPPPPTLTIINTTSVFPSGSITVHGANFKPDATVSFSSDGSNLPLASAPPSVLPVSSLSSLDNLVFSAQQARLQRAYLDARVQYDGTFDLALSVPPSWQGGTVHKIEAKESGSGLTAFVDVKVLAKVYASSPPASQSTLQAA